MTEQPAAYTVGDPGDETRNHLFGRPVEISTTATTPRFGYTMAAVEEVVPEEYAPKQRQEGICWNCGKPVGTGDHLCRFEDTRQGRSFAVSMAPTAEEMAAAIREFARTDCSSFEGRPEWRDARVRLNELAARLPGGSR